MFPDIDFGQIATNMVSGATKAMEKIKGFKSNGLKRNLVALKLTERGIPRKGYKIFHEDEKIGEGKGSIALQIHDGGGIKVSWKNIKIKVLK